ncbi:MAG: CYTH and CHAD domain-containing protein [Streptosporangiaceae bacterium]|nr:CYTH and CHAD domain-containing protein [Streptosporangiaceae bacterium]MBV9855979.1 CYTH and CHAD domain-containing protein [Streptosporangiaceae bacterium]
MVTEIHEREQKYEAGPTMRMPSLDGLPQVASVSGPEAETLVAEYYDTDDLRLLRAGITLRRREGGDDEGWHLKLPEGAGRDGAASRRELRVPPGQPGDPVPDELARLVRVHTRSARLRPVARIETRRRRTTLRDATGASLAEVLADEVAAQTLGASTTLSRWNEIEVELTGGSPKLLRAADKQLRHGGLRPAGRSAKLERALATELPPSRDGRPVAPLTRRSPAAEVVLAYLREHAARLKSLDPAVRRDEPDSIHQMRVTTRRLRSTLQSFPMILPASATGHLRDELKWLGQVLGDARDNEVLGEHLRDELAGTRAELVMGPAQARLRAHFAPLEAAARAAVLEALDSQRYFAMLDELDRLADEPPLTAEGADPAAAVLPGAVGRDHRRTRRRMRRAMRRPAGTGRDTSLHEARKAAKRTRYAAEALAPAFGKKAGRVAKRMKKVQSVLGNHHDAVTARAAVREIGVQAHLAGETAFSFGLLHEREEHKALACQHQAEKAWKRAERPKARKLFA